MLHLGTATAAGNTTAARPAGPAATTAAAAAAEVPVAEPKHQPLGCGGAAEQAPVHPCGEGAAGQAQSV